MTKPSSTLREMSSDVARMNDEAESSCSLSFVVMGVPRSGTSAAAYSLNLHPELMCGIEYFPDAQSACVGSLPDAFQYATYAHSPVCDLTRTTYQAKKERARIFGNKDPRYYFHLPYLNSKVPLCKKICIYRARLDFWESWDTRADDAQDVHWDRGQTGFFGVLELICMLGALADVPNSGEVLLVNYDQLFFDDINILGLLYDYLGVTRDPTALALFREQYFSPVGISKKRTTEEARHIYQYLQLGELERRLFVRPVVTNTEVADALREYLRFSQKLTAALIDEHFSQMPIRDLAYFLGAQELRRELTRQDIPARTLRLLEKDEQLNSRIRQDLIQLYSGLGN